MSEEKISQHLTERLRTKAHVARVKVANKAILDADCDLQDEHHVHITEHITIFYQYLSKFLQTGTLDLPSAQPFIRSAKLPYREAHKYQYVYVDKHIDKAALEIDKKWLKAQDNYIMLLKKEELFDLYGYTYNGDVFVNNYLRGRFDEDMFRQYLSNLDELEKKHEYFALFFPVLRVLKRFVAAPEMMKLIFNDPRPSDADIQEVISILQDEKYVDKYMKVLAVAPKLSYDRFWIPVLEDYTNSIESIIKKAPPTPKAMVLYRGVDNDYFLTEFMKDHKSRVHVANSFVSTSASVDVVNDFIDYEKRCCFMRLYVPANTRMIMMMGVSRFKEAEFLLSHKTQFYITKAKTERFCRGDGNHLEMRTTSLVVI